MELLPYRDEHLALTEALELDPRMMGELGGPADAAGVRRAHRTRVEMVANGGWWFVIVPEPDGPPAGTIGIWESAVKEEPLHEIGWMVLPEFQGRGIAREALRMILERARTDPDYSSIHAFPGITNVASNALCRGAGFRHVEEMEVRFRGRPLRVNHWALDVSSS